MKQTTEQQMRHFLAILFVIPIVCPQSCKWSWKELAKTPFAWDVLGCAPKAQCKVQLQNWRKCRPHEPSEEAEPSRAETETAQRRQELRDLQEQLAVKNAQIAAKDAQIAAKAALLQSAADIIAHHKGRGLSGGIRNQQEEYLLGSLS